MIVPGTEPTPTRADCYFRQQLEQGKFMIQRCGACRRAEIGKTQLKLDPQPYEHPYFPLNPISSYALAAARHMHQ